MRAALAALVLLQTTAALADPDAFVAPSARAAKAFNEGRELKAAGRVDEACQRFAASWDAEHAPGTEVNLADCREREGRLLEAWQLFDEAARISDQQGNQTRATFARNRATAIDARLMTVEIRIAEPFVQGMAVTLDGRQLAVSTTVSERMDPRTITLRVSVPQGKAFAVVVPAQAGKIVVDVPSFVRTETVRRRSRLWIAGGLVLAGIGGLVISDRLNMIADDVRDGIEGCMLDSHYQGTCENPIAQQVAIDKLALANRNELASKIVLTTSVLSVIGAAVVWYTAPKERVLLTPTATADSVGVALAGRF